MNAIDLEVIHQSTLQVARELTLNTFPISSPVACSNGSIACVIDNAEADSDQAINATDHGIVNFAQGAFVMLGGMIASAAVSIFRIIGCSGLVIALLAVFFSSTKTGKAMRACSIDRDAAALLGIRVSRMLALAFGLSAGLGDLAGDGHP